MGAVYQSIQLDSGRVRALKLLKREYMNKDPKAVERFRNEFQTGDLVGHRNIVRVYDYFDLGSEEACIVMEFIEGESLRDYLRRQETAMRFDEVVMIASQIAFAIGALHLKGFLHCDLKPENIMLTKDEQNQILVKVLDFGVAKSLKSLGLPRSKSSIYFKEFVGTMLYTSPENCRGEDLDERSDIYSLGIILYEMLAGQPPFTGRSMDVENQHRLNVPVPISTRRVDTPAALAELVMRALNKDPKARPQTAKEVADRLRWIEVEAKTEEWQNVTPTPTNSHPDPTPQESVKLPPSQPEAKIHQKPNTRKSRSAEQPREPFVNITIMKPSIGENRSAPVVRSRHELFFPGRNKTKVLVGVLAAGLVLALLAGSYSYKYAAGRHQRYFEKGVAHLEKNENDQAVDALSTAISLDTSQFLPYYYRAVARHKQKDTEGAIKDYSEVIRLVPHFIPAYQGRAGLYSSRGEHQNAIGDYTQVLRFVPNGNLYQLRGDAYLMNKAYNQAVTDYTEAIRLDPNNPNVFASRSAAYNKRGLTGDRYLAAADRVRTDQLRK